jgi:hypothetical protein
MTDIRSNPPEEAMPPLPQPAMKRQAGCPQCSGDLELITVIGNFGADPGYKLYECAACKRMEWRMIPPTVERFRCSVSVT